jgi:hypothetical protein
MKALAIASHALVFTFLAGTAAAQSAAPSPQPSSDSTTRAAIIEQSQAEKAAKLQPYKPGAAEYWLNYAETMLTTGMHFHPYFESAYSGGGFTMGVGYRKYAGQYNTFDVRGSLTPKGYKRIEAEFLAPRLFDRQGVLSVVGGWREATQVGYYGQGTSNTSKNDRANYGFTQPYAIATLHFHPAHRLALLGGGFDVSEWRQEPGSGNEPSVDEVYTPETLPGLGAHVTYFHSQAVVGIDSRPAPDYARRGGFYGVTFHDYSDKDGQYGFTQIDYEAIQHVPILREAWVLSFRGLVSTTGTKTDQQIPFFMLPALGGGSSLRGFSSWRFRDRNRLLLQGEWRVVVNRFVDMAVFTDMGKVTEHAGDLNLDGLKSDYGLGFRFHGPLTTPLRIELAKSNEGLAIVFGASAAF